MNPCNNCIVDMICIKKCPMFKIDLERVQTDDVTYLTRCMKNSGSIEKTYEITNEIKIKISMWEIKWYKNGKLHRDNDKPATMWWEGFTIWYKNGKRHRDNDQPAVIDPDGTRFWYRNGYLHRGDGKPAIIENGRQYWYKHGKQYEPESIKIKRKKITQCNTCTVDAICIQKCPKFEIDLDRLQTDEMTYLKRCMNNQNMAGKFYNFPNNVLVTVGSKFIIWFKTRRAPMGGYHRRIHRDNDQPAIIHSDGSKCWLKKGILHRDNNQPVIIKSDGTKEFWKDGVQYEPMQ